MKECLRSLLLAVGFMVALSILAPAPALAQLTAADSAAVLLGLAQDLQTRGRTDLARALYDLILERYPASPEAADAERLLSRSAVIEQSGRTELIVWGTTYGAWLGVAVAGSLGAEDSEPFGAGLLVGGPGGFLAAKSYADRTRLTEGQARAITLGGMWGIWQGAGWRELLDLGTRKSWQCVGPGGGEPCYEESETPSEVVFRAMLLGGLAGVGTGVALARTRSITAGTATAVNFAALWGTWYGFALSELLDLQEDGSLTLTLLGGNAGLVATALLAPRAALTRPRARLISIAGVAGLIGGFGLDLLLQVEDGRTAILFPTLGSIAGLAMGAAGAHDPDLPPRAPDDDLGIGEAILHLDNGRLRAGFPAPLPAVLTIERNGRRASELGVRVQVARIRF